MPPPLILNPRSKERLGRIIAIGGKGSGAGGGVSVFRSQRNSRTRLINAGEKVY